MSLERDESYAKFVTHRLRTTNLTESKRTDQMLLAALGLNGEAGEVSEHIKKHLLHDKPLDRQAVIKELGDVLWYFILMCNVLDTTLDVVMSENVKKLCERHGETWELPR